MEFGPPKAGRIGLRLAAVASSVVAVVLSLGLSATPAQADCAPDPAASGQTVTCSGTDADGFAASGGVTNLTGGSISGGHYGVLSDGVSL